MLNSNLASRPGNRLQKKRMAHFYFQVSMSRAQVNCNKQKTVDEFGRMRERMRRK